MFGPDAFYFDQHQICADDEIVALDWSSIRKSRPPHAQTNTATMTTNEVNCVEIASCNSYYKLVFSSLITLDLSRRCIHRAWQTPLCFKWFVFIIVVMQKTDFYIHATTYIHSPTNFHIWTSTKTLKPKLELQIHNWLTRHNASTTELTSPLTELAQPDIALQFHPTALE